MHAGLMLSAHVHRCNKYYKLVKVVINASSLLYLAAGYNISADWNAKLCQIKFLARKKFHMKYHMVGNYRG